MIMEADFYHEFLSVKTKACHKGMKKYGMKLNIKAL